MIDIFLLIGRLVFVVLLFLFLFLIMRTGIGLVKGQRKKEKSWVLCLEKAPGEIRGVKRAVHGPVIAGRSPNADIVIGDGYVSARHARFALMGDNLFVENLSQTNGTYVNGQRISEPTVLREGDLVTLGNGSIRVRFE